MRRPYKHSPEYRNVPLDPEERHAVYDAYVSVADIDEFSEIQINGLYAAKQKRFNRVEFIGDISSKAKLGIAATWQAMTELNGLQIVSFTNAYDVLIGLEARLFNDAQYTEEHAREFFRFAASSNKQYYWDGSAGAIREVREREEAYQLLKEADRLNKTPTIPRTNGQFVSRHSQGRTS